MAILKRASSQALVLAGVMLGGCAMEGSDSLFTTGSLTGQAASEQKAADGVCLTLASRIEALRKDGIPDTTDNNGDGIVDERDIAPDKTIGPLLNPPAPERGSPKDHFYQVTNGFPFAFTNPFLLDLNGNGKFDRVGVKNTP